MKKIFLFILAAILVTGLVSCAQPNDGPVEALTIQTDRDNYLPTMSSTVGIGLIPVYTIEKPSETVQFHWCTNYGYFIKWEPPDFEVNILGTEIITTDEKIYGHMTRSKWGLRNLRL